MERIQINRNSPIGGLKALDIRDIIERDDELLISLNSADCYQINEGQTLMFKRYIYDDSGANFTLTEYVQVIEEDSAHTIHTTKIPVERIMLETGSDAVRYVSGLTEDEQPLFYDYWIVRCDMDHHLYAQDLALENGQELSFYDYEDNLLGVYSDLGIPLRWADRSVTMDDCITFLDEVDTCGKSYDTVKEYRYDFLPGKVSRDMLIIRDFESAITPYMAYFVLKYNPFYFTYVNHDEEGKPNEIDEYGNPVVHCKLYGDAWWFNIQKTLDNQENNYYNSGNTRSILAMDTAYWNVDLGLSTPADETNLGTEDLFGASYIEDLEQSLIPDIVDMERLKYSPMIYSARSEEERERYYKWASTECTDYPEIYVKEWITPENTEPGSAVTAYYRTVENNKKTMKELEDEEVRFVVDYNIAYDGGVSYSLERDCGNYYLTDEIVSNELDVATGITLYFHFRKRVEIPDEVRDTTANTNTNLTSGNVYYDGWYIDPDAMNTVWWNTMEYSGTSFDSTRFDAFMENSSHSSDLLGYLNFTDDDVYYQKQKVSQSFVRLLFYTSTDPLEQKLLYYSTVFLDGGDLYGKYVKQLLFMEENGLMASATNLNAAVVFCSANTVSGRVDTKISITNEFDRTKSAEGFNIYLFKEDKNLRLENGEKTIYMKVEFNHAGNGKTTPMILWPRAVDSDGNPTEQYSALTVDNFIENLYIPVKLTYIDGRYVYYLPTAENGSDGVISLVLFEPKLDYGEESTEGALSGSTEEALEDGN